MYLSFKENISNNEPKTKEIDLVKEKIIHPKYNVECKIHKRKTRRVMIASLYGKEVILYHTAQYKFFNPETNKQCYYTPPIDGLIGKKRHDTKQYLLLVSLP